MKEWGVTRASRRRGNGCPASHARCHTRCGHELPRAPTCCARARRRSEGPTSPRHRPHGMVSLCAPQPRRLPRSAVLFKATSSTLFRPFLHFHFFFHPPFYHRRSRMYGRSIDCFPPSQSPLGCLSIGRAPAGGGKWAVSACVWGHVLPASCPMRAPGLCTPGEARAEPHVSGRGKGRDPRSEAEVGRPDQRRHRP